MTKNKWSVKFTQTALKNLKKVDKETQRRVQKFIRNKLLEQTDPRQSGKPLSGPYAGLWRYRIGDYRLICNIEDQELVILALTIGHRKGIYKKPISH